MIEQMMRSTAFGKITVVYGHIDENGASVRKWLARKMPFTDKRLKNPCLSVNLSEILAHRPEQEKIRANHGTNFKCYSVAYGVMSVRLHTFIIGFRLTPPLSQAPLLGQDELTRRKRDLDTRGLSVRLHTFTFQQSQTLACLSANLFPSNFDSKAIWHFSASRFGCCRNPN